jgi:hypothetical protein
MDPASHPPSLTRAGGEGLFPAYGTILPGAVSVRGLIDEPLAWRALAAAVSLLAIPLLSRLCGGSLLAGSLGFLAAGLLPYALLFWEHGPAVSLFLLAAVLLRRSLHRRAAPPWWLAAALPACRLRPELAPATVALLAVMLFDGRRLPGAGMTLTWSALALVVAGLGTLLFPESVAGGQVLANLPPAPVPLLSSRLEVLGSWTLSGPPVLVAAVLLWGGASLGLLLADRGPVAARKALMAAGTVSAGAMLYPIARGTAGTMSVLTLSPAVVLLPVASWRARGEARTLILAGMLGGVLVALLAPTHGMFQFGPRFLLGPVALAAAGGCLALERIRRRSMRAAAYSGALLLALLGSARGALFCGYFRASHHGLQRSLAGVRASAVCTDEEWLPLVCWPQAESRPLLVTAPAEAESLAASGLDLVWISSSTALRGPLGAAGYRGLRYSLPAAGSRELPSPPPGDPMPSPPTLAPR